MKFIKAFVGSDYHINFWDNFDFTDRDAVFNRINLDPDENYDVIILAGDIGECHNAFQQGIYISFMRHICSLGVPVIVIKGNHENYNNNIQSASFFLKTLSIEFFNNLHFLDNVFVDLVLNNQKIRFFGGTLWTNFNKLNPLAVLEANTKMNDFNAYIKKAGYQKFNAVDANDQHQITLDKIYTASNISDDMQFVVITHHSPILQASYKFRKDRNMESVIDNLDYSYASDLTDFIDSLQNKPSYWIFGHIHAPFRDSYMDIEFINNSYGYIGGEKILYQNPSMLLEFKE